MDPDDGTNRTPKGLLHSGSIQIPITQLAGLISENEDSAQLRSLTETAVDVLPGMGSISIGGSGAAENTAEGRQIVQDTSDSMNVCYVNFMRAVGHPPGALLFNLLYLL